MPESEKSKKRQRDDEESEKSRKKRKVDDPDCARKFSSSWCREFKWLTQFDGIAKCTICNKVLGNKKDTLRNKVDIKQSRPAYFIVSCEIYP